MKGECFLSIASVENPENWREGGHKLRSLLHPFLDLMGTGFLHFSRERSKEKQQPCQGEPALTTPVTLGAAHDQDCNGASKLDLG